MIKQFLYKTVFIIIVFLYIYMPPIFNFEMIYILGGVAYFILFLYYQNELKLFLFSKNIIVFSTILMCSVLVLFVTLMFTTKEFTEIFSVLFILLFSLPCAILLVILIRKDNYDLFSFLHLLLNVAIVQSLLSIIFFLNPTLKELIHSLYYSAYINSESMIFWSKYRLNGLAFNLMYSTPIVQGFMASVAVWMYLNKSKLYFIYIPFLLISSLINARTGLIVFVVCVILIIFFIMLKTPKSIIKIFFFVNIFGLISFLFFIFIENKYPFTAKWIKDAISETFSFLNGENTGYYVAMKNMMFFPQLNEFFVGSGMHHLFTPYKNLFSDIGYINDLFLGGMFFLLLLYSSFIYLFVSNFRKSGDKRNVIVILMLVTLFLVNIKGFAFRLNEIINLFLLISVFLFSFKLNRLRIINERKKNIFKKLE